MLLSVITGLDTLGIAILAFRAGGYARQVEINTGRIGVLEQSGSPHLQAIEAKIDAMNDAVKRLDSRFDNLPCRDGGTCPR